MKLELKHLAPYLPYGLKSWSGEKEILITGSTLYRMETIVIKPILRPLSDLTEKECKKLLNNDHIFNFWYGKDKDGDYIYKEGYTSSIYRSYKGMPYSMVQHLFQWHFDVFGLIDEGLAIDINTLKL